MRRSTSKSRTTQRTRSAAKHPLVQTSLVEDVLALGSDRVTTDKTRFQTNTTRTYGEVTFMIPTCPLVRTGPHCMVRAWPSCSMIPKTAPTILRFELKDCTGHATDPPRNQTRVFFLNHFFVSYQILCFVSNCLFRTKKNICA